MSAGQSNLPNQPFIPQSDRPDVTLNLDTRLGELSVRDFFTVLKQHLAEATEPTKEHQAESIPWPPPGMMPYEAVQPKFWFYEGLHPKLWFHEGPPPPLGKGTREKGTREVFPGPGFPPTPAQPAMGLQEVIRRLTGLEEEFKKLSDRVKKLEQKRSGS